MPRMVQAKQEAKAVQLKCFVQLFKCKQTVGKPDVAKT